MKANFEKGTKVCSCCKKELPLNMFYKHIRMSDGLSCYCKKCNNMKSKELQGRKYYVFNRKGRKRGNAGMLKRDYELTKEELKIREEARKKRGSKRDKGYGMLIYYSGGLEELSIDEYKRAMIKEYSRQKSCAIRGYIGRVTPSEDFLFDFDLEKMLKENVYIRSNNGRQYITKWWKGEIRHWTVKDGIWKE